MIPEYLVEKDIAKWLEEDIPLWDVSAQIIPEVETTAKIIAKQDGIICGLDIAKKIFSTFSVDAQSEWKDGDYIKDRTEVLSVKGNSRGILQAERTALNILSHLSGIATLTHKFVKLINNPKVKIAGTRKTLPGLRKYEKWAIHCGGGDTHRTSLSDMVMLKENHLAAAGGITQAINQIRQKISFSTKIEVEVRNIEEAREAAINHADIILLDNYSLDDLQASIDVIRSTSPTSLIEISGNVSEKTLSNYSNFDIDIISSGKLTHSVTAFDFSLLFDSVD